MESVHSTSERAATPWRKYLIFGGLALALGLFVGWGGLQLWTNATRGFTGTLIQSPAPAQDFTLTAHTGEPLSLSDFRGKVVMIYFGYTYCPDVCPATLIQLSRALALLGDDAEQVQVVMISVDPERDTLERLGEYVTYFDESFIGMTGTDAELTAVATPLGIFYEKHPGTVETGYLVDHTASVVAIDPDGYLKLVYPFNTDAADIAADLEQIIK